MLEERRLSGFGASDNDGADDVDRSINEISASVGQLNISAWLSIIIIIVIVGGRA